MTGRVAVHRGSAADCANPEVIDVQSDDLPNFIREVALVVGDSDDEYEITRRVAELLSAFLASGYRPGDGVLHDR